MKRIIEGRTFNTETATKVAFAKVDRPYLGADEEQTLYLTRSGAFFVHVRDPVDNQDDIEILTGEEAQNWVLEGEVELFNSPFPDPPEAAAEEPSKTEATIFIRVPQSLKRQIDATAKAAGQSVNAWAMRCLERCLDLNRHEQAKLNQQEAEGTTE